MVCLSTVIPGQNKQSEWRIRTVLWFLGQRQVKKSEGGDLRQLGRRNRSQEIVRCEDVSVWWASGPKRDSKPAALAISKQTFGSSERRSRLSCRWYALLFPLKGHLDRHSIIFKAGRGQWYEYKSEQLTGLLSYRSSATGTPVTSRGLLMKFVCFGCYPQKSFFWLLLIRCYLVLIGLRIMGLQILHVQLFCILNWT